jgi:quinol monooxygenase YgiN
MFGTIGHLTPKPGGQEKFRALMDDWERTMRPQIPGNVIQLSGRPKDNPNQVVFIALFQDEETYRNLAANPDQDAWFRKMMELTEGDVTWEDVQIDDVRQS